MPFKKGQSGNPDGRSPAKRERSFYATLDNEGIPKSIDCCLSVLDGSHPKLQALRNSANYIRLQLDAAKILMSKAPDRHEHSGNVTLVETLYAGHKNSDTASLSTS